MSKVKLDSKDKTIAMLCVLIVLLILLLILTIILKGKPNHAGVKIYETKTGYTIDVAYNEYLSNLKANQQFAFYDVSKGVVDQFVITDQNEFYVILNSKNKNYKSLKNRLVDITGFCDAETCEQGIKIDSIKAINVFSFVYKKTTYVFVLDENGNLYNIRYVDNSFALEWLSEVRYAVQVYNSIEPGIEKIYAVDIQGKIIELNDLLDNLK